MTEATDKDGQAAADGTSAGDQLRRARESRNLTTQQVAQALHLDSWILEALEQNRFKDVGAPVFVKGHLRKYASEIGLDGQQLMEAYYRADDTPETPGLVTETFTRPGGDQQGRWPVIVVSALLALLIILVAFLWLRGGGLPSLSLSKSSGEAADAVTANEPSAMNTTARDSEDPRENEMTATTWTGAEAAAAVAAEPSEGVAEQTDSEIGPAVDLETTAPAARPPTAMEQAQAAGQVRISISLQNDSWVEIYDANKRRLFFDLARAGSTKNVTGAPPVQVLLGNSDEARVRVNGDVWPIPAAARRGKTARFTIR